MHLKEWFTNNQKRKKMKNNNPLCCFFKCIKRGGGKKKILYKIIGKMHLIKSGLFVLMSNFIQKNSEANSVSSVGCRSFSPHHVRSLDDRRTDGRTAVCGGAAGGFPVASAAQQNPQFLTKLANRSRTLAHARANFDFFRTFTSLFLRSHEFFLHKSKKESLPEKRC